MSTKARAAAKPVDEVVRTGQLRELRLAAEAASRTAGTWGDRQVGEVRHETSQTVYVQIWKGARRPDPLIPRKVRPTGVTKDEWDAVLTWLKGRHPDGFSERLIAWDVSADEADRIRRESIVRHREAGRTVINPPDVAGRA